MNQSLLSSLLAFNSKHNLFNADQTLLVATSGGVDSVVLVNLLHACKQPMVLAHCNFQLRGDESERDENFVRSLAQQFHLPLQVKKFETNSFAASEKISIQLAARKLRYNWFNELMNEAAMNGEKMLLCTAHHANDSVETMLMNVMRGTGIEGMHGILPKANNIVRPLLFATKDEIVLYAKQNNLQWVEDSSNESSKYSRNFVRQQIVPAAEKLFPSAVSNMLGTIEKMKEAEILYQQAVSQHKKKLMEAKGNEWLIPVLKLKQAEPLSTIVYEIIKGFGFGEAQVPEVLKLLQAESGSYLSSATHRIIRHRHHLIIASLHNDAAEIHVIEKDDEVIAFQQGSLAVRTTRNFDSEKVKQLAADEAWLDAKMIQFPLVLRPWKAGDYLCPLGMRKKKKVSRLLIDLRLSKTEKEKVWVIESNKKILWVVGHRIDDRFKIHPATQSIIQFSFKPKN